MIPFINKVQGMFPINFRKRPTEASEPNASKKRRELGTSIFRPKEQVTFDDLNDDIHRELFKYLNNGDSARFELVNKRFGGLLRDEWKSRKVLAFGTWRFGNTFIPMCSTVEHQVKESDFLPVKSFKTRVQLLKRCTNLKVLVWDKGISKSVGLTINACCPNIEHIDGLNDAAFKAIAANGSCKKVVCVRSRKGITEALSLEPITFALAETSWSVADLRNFEEFEGPCSRVQTLHWPNFNISYGPLLTLMNKLPNLQVIRSNGTHYYTSIEHLPPFEIVSFGQAFDEGLFRKLVEKAGAAAKTVKIYPTHQLTREAMELVCKNCPNVERLDVPVSLITIKTAPKFEVFTKLHHLHLKCSRFGDAPCGQLYQIINKSPKLRKVDCLGLSCANGVEVITACFERASANCTRRLELTISFEQLRTWLCSQRSGLNIYEIPANLIVNNRSLLDYFPVYDSVILKHLFNEE